MESEMTGIQSIQWARELSKLPNCSFIIVYHPYSRSKGIASSKTVTKKGCRYRSQLPKEAFSIDSENFFLFTDESDDPKMCYRILIRFMGFPQDGYKLHKINWI